MKAMDNYLFLAVSVLAAAANNVFLHLLSAKNVKYNPFLFNAGLSLVWIVILFFFQFGGEYTSATVLYGILYGLVLAAFLFFKAQAMVTGPILLTSLLGCSSFVITTIFNAVYWHETVDAFNVSGIVLMLVSLYLITVKPTKDSGGQAKFNPVWIFYCAFFLIFAVSTGIIFKFHQTYDKANTNQMMFVSAIVSAVAFLIFYAISKLLKARKNSKGLSCEGESITTENAVKIESAAKNESTALKRERALLIILTLASGVVSCVYNRLNVYLSGALPSIIFFLVFNGGVVILASLAGIFIFKEKLTNRQTLGVAIGLTAILLISKFFGLF